MQYTLSTKNAKTKTNEICRKKDEQVQSNGYRNKIQRTKECYKQRSFVSDECGYTRAVDEQERYRITK